MILKVEQTFQGYIIDTYTGYGSGCTYREVYIAHTPDEEDERYVILTIYSVDDMPKNMNTKSIREFEICSKLTSRAFPKFMAQGWDTVEGKPVAWMTQELVMYHSLDEVLDSHVLDEEHVLDLFCDILDGAVELARMTKNGGHFNICPDTIIVSEMDVDDDRDMQAYLIGLDHASDACTGKTSFDTKTIDPLFRAKETYLGRFSTVSDVYSLGMLLAYMFCRDFPFNCKEQSCERNILDAVAKKELPDTIPDGLKSIIYKAVSPNAAKRYASMYALRKAIREYRGEDVTDRTGTEEWMTVDDEEATSENRQSTGMETPHVKVEFSKKQGNGFKDVAGMDVLKNKLRRNFVDVITHKDLARQFVINVPSMILFGPPGTGKTYISMRLAEECGMECSVINPSDLGSIYVHGSQKMIRELFDKAAKKAKKNGKGVLLIFDEFDALCPQRTPEDQNNQSGEVAELLAQLNNSHERNIYVIGTTNCLDRIDKAIMRKGRIDEVVYVGLPDENCRKQLFEYELTQRPHEENIDFNALVKMTDGFSPSDIAYLVKESARNSFEASLKNEGQEVVKISQSMLEEVIRASHPSVSRMDVTRYERMRDELNNSWKPERRIGYRF
jgi:transitional endoplasmic reticulum ATPase